MSAARRLLAGALAALFLLVPAFGSAAQKTASSYEVLSTENALVWQLMLIDNSASLVGVNNPVFGEGAATGDWSRGIDGRNWKRATLLVNEYGTGSISVSLWSCRYSGPIGIIAGVDAPGVEDPAAAPSPADPDPLCVRLATGIDGNDGDDNGGDQVDLWAAGFGVLFARIDTCTGNCDAQITLELGR